MPKKRSRSRTHAGSTRGVHGSLVEHGLRRTRQRVALYKALAATKSHPTAEQLFLDAKQRLRGRVRGLSLATVYNTLEAFTDCGLVQKLACKDGPARYDANVANHPHLCDPVTGKIFDVPEHLSARLLAGVPKPVLQAIEASMGCRIEHVRIELIAAASPA
jgi:Fe2+ or Zn2+ uptake regulation protein